MLLCPTLEMHKLPGFKKACGEKTIYSIHLIEHAVDLKGTLTLFDMQCAPQVLLGHKGGESPSKIIYLLTSVSLKENN